MKHRPYSNYFLLDQNDDIIYHTHYTRVMLYSQSCVRFLHHRFCPIHYLKAACPALVQMAHTGANPLLMEYDCGTGTAP